MARPGKPLPRQISIESPEGGQSASTAGGGATRTRETRRTLYMANVERKITVDRQLIRPEDGEPRFGPVKRAASNRVVPLPSVVADALAFHLQTYGEGPEGLIFTNAKGESIYRTSLARSSGGQPISWDCQG